jgi:N-acetylglutamate synthase-like GNAT family acetyltransferase
MLTKNHLLNALQLDQLDKLLEQCKQHDGNSIPTYQHLLSIARSTPCNILYFDQGQLVGFLSLFFFYEDACEVTLLIAPAYREQDLSLQLLKEAAPMISKEIKKLIFSVPHKLKPSLNFMDDSLLSQGPTSSEYQLHRDGNEPLPDSKKISIRPAILADLSFLCAIDSACFPAQQGDMATRFRELLDDTNYQLFIAQHEGVPVGKLHVHHEQMDSIRFTDIAILPAMQKKGFGSAMIALCINQCLAIHQSNINIDVTANNEHALNLYLSLGFEVINAYDFWCVSTDELKAKILGDVD